MNYRTLIVNTFRETVKTNREIFSYKPSSKDIGKMYTQKDIKVISFTSVLNLSEIQKISIKRDLLFNKLEDTPSLTTNGLVFEVRTSIESDNKDFRLGVFGKGSSKLIINPSRANKLQHNICSLVFGISTDKKFKTVFGDGFSERSPDFIEIDEQTGDVYILEIKTSFIAEFDEFSRIINEEIVKKYEDDVELVNGMLQNTNEKGGRCILGYILVAPGVIVSNLELKSEMVDVLMSSYHLGITMKNILISKGVNMDNDADIKSTIKISEQIKLAADHVKMKLKDSSVGPEVTNNMIKGFDEDVTPEEEDKILNNIFSDCLEEYANNMKIDKADMAMKRIEEYKKMVNSDSSRLRKLDDASRVVKFPLVVPKGVSLGDKFARLFQPGKFDPIDALGSFVRKVMLEYVKIARNQFTDEAVEQQYNIAMEEKSEEKMTLLKTYRNRNNRITVKDMTENEMVSLAERGMSHKRDIKKFSGNNQAFLKHLSSEKNKHFSTETNVDDITSFIMTEFKNLLHERSNDNFDIIKQRTIDLYRDGKTFSGADVGLAEEFVNDFFKTGLSAFCSFMESVVEEINLSVKQFTSGKGQYIVKPIRDFHAWVILRPTAGDSHISTIIVGKRDSFRMDYNTTVFGNIYVDGDYFYTDPFSMNEDKISLLLNLSIKMCGFYGTLHEIFRVPVTRASMIDKERLIPTMGFIFLSYLQVKKQTSDSLQPPRFMYMRSIAGNAFWKSDVLQPLLKVTDVPRNRLIIFLVKRYSIAFTQMARNRPSLVKQQIGVREKGLMDDEPNNDEDEDDDESVTADKMSGLINFIDGRQLESFEQSLQLSYLGALASKDDLGQKLFTYRTLFSKLVKESMNFYKSNKQYMGNEEPEDISSLKTREYSKKLEILQREHAKSYLQGISSQKFEELIEGVVLSRLLEMDTVGLGTMKSSAIRSPSGMFNESILKNSTASKIDKNSNYYRVQEKYNKRTKLLHAIKMLTEKNKIGSNPFHNLSDLIKEFMDIGMVLQIVAKNQLYAPREIFIMEAIARILTLFLETISNAINSFMPNEFNSKGKEKYVQKIDYYSKLSQKLSGGERVSVTINNALDGSKWANSFVMSLFACQLRGLIPENMYYVCVGILNEFTNKKIEFPVELMAELFNTTNVIQEYRDKNLNMIKKSLRSPGWGIDPTSIFKEEKELILRTSKTEEEVVFRLNKAKKTYDSNVAYEELNGKMRLTDYQGTTMIQKDNFGQGLLGKTSSTHAAFTTFYNVKVCRFIKKWVEGLMKALGISEDGFGEESELFIKWLTTSDDSESTISLLLDKLKSTNTKVIEFANILLVLCSLSIVHQSKLVLVKISPEKSTFCLFNKISEFNSEWTVFNTTIYPYIKWMASVMNDHAMTTFKERMNVMSDLRKDILKGGGSIWLAGLAQEAHFRIFYSDLGCNVNPLFDMAKDKILKLKHPSLGYFAWEPDCCVGIFGFNYAMFNLMKNSEMTRRVEQLLRSQFGTSYDSYGNVTIQIKLYSGEKVAFAKWIKKYNPDVKNMEYLESNPDVLYRRPENVEETMALLDAKAMSPNIGISLLRNSTNRTKVVGVYAMQQDVITLVDTSREKEFRMKQKEEYKILRTNMEDMKKLSEFVDIDDIKFENKTKISMLKLLYVMDDRVNVEMNFLSGYKRDFLSSVFGNNENQIDVDYMFMSDFDRESNDYYSLLFPHAELYKVANDIISTINRENVSYIRNYRPNKRIKIVSADKKSFLSKSLSSIVKEIWFSRGKGKEGYSIGTLSTFDQYKLLYKWLGNNVEDSLVNSPFYSHISMAAMINRPNERRATFEIIGPARGVGDRAKLLSVISGCYGKTMLLVVNPERNKKDMSVRYHLNTLNSKLIKLRDTPFLTMEQKSTFAKQILTEPVVKGETKIIFNYTKSADDIVRSSLSLNHKEKMLALIQMVMCMSLDKKAKEEMNAKVNVLLSAIRLGSFGYYLKPQNYIASKMRYEGEGIFLLKLQSIVCKIFFLDNFVTQIISSDPKGLKERAYELTEKLIEMGITRSKEVIFETGLIVKEYEYNLPNKSVKRIRSNKVSSSSCPIYENKYLEMEIKDATFSVSFSEGGNIRLFAMFKNETMLRGSTVISFRPDTSTYEPQENVLDDYSDDSARGSIISCWDKNQSCDPIQLCIAISDLIKEQTVIQKRLSDMENEDTYKVNKVLNMQLEMGSTRNKLRKDKLGDFIDRWTKNPNQELEKEKIMLNNKQKLIDRDIKWLRESFIFIYRIKKNLGSDDIGNEFIEDKQQNDQMNLENQEPQEFDFSDYDEIKDIRIANLKFISESIKKEKNIESLMEEVDVIDATSFEDIPDFTYKKRDFSMKNPKITNDRLKLNKVAMLNSNIYDDVITFAEENTIRKLLLSKYKVDLKNKEWLEESESEVAIDKESASEDFVNMLLGGHNRSVEEPKLEKAFKIVKFSGKSEINDLE